MFVSPGDASSLQTLYFCTTCSFAFQSRPFIVWKEFALVKDGPEAAEAAPVRFPGFAVKQPSCAAPNIAKGMRPANHSDKYINAGD